MLHLMRTHKRKTRNSNTESGSREVPPLHSLSLDLSRSSLVLTLPSNRKGLTLVGQYRIGGDEEFIVDGRKNLVNGLGSQRCCDSCRHS